MCCRLVIGNTIHKPGDRIVARSATKTGAGKWAGFARSETAEATWIRFDTELDIPAVQFAENNRNTGRKTFGKIVEGHVIHAIGDRLSGHIKVLTRDATQVEENFFGHERVPVTGPARF